MQSNTESYSRYGRSHGTAVYYDSTKPDTDAFLAYMEARLPKHGVEPYMDGFMAGLLGECKREFPQMRALRKDGKHKFSSVAPVREER